jgi:hypothetical protein
MSHLFLGCVGLFLWVTALTASPLVTKGFFPTANFTQSWQSYLPDDVPMQKVNIYTSPTYVMQPGFQLSASLRAEVVRTKTGFRYTYTVTNAAGSLQALSVLGVDRMAPITAQVPVVRAGLMGAKNPYGNVIGWYPKSAKQARTRVVEMVLGNTQAKIPIVEDGLLPGETLAGLSLESEALPGIVSAFCRGKGWLIKVSQGDFVPEPFNEYVSGKTVGPVLRSQGMDSKAFAGYMRELVGESIALGWLSGDVALKSQSFAKELEISESPAMVYKSFYTYLTGFWFGTSEMTSEGQALLLLNLEYGMKQFGQPSNG